MSYLEESEHDDAAGRGRRPARAARPAWDAATYGRPDDTRRVRRAPPDDPEPYASFDSLGTSRSYPDVGEASSSYPGATYSDSGYADSTYSDSTYSSYSDGSYPDSSYPDSSYPDSSYPDSSYPDSSYPDSSYPDSSYPDSSDPESAYPGSTVESSNGPSYAESAYGGSSYGLSPYVESAFAETSSAFGSSYDPADRDPSYSAQSYSAQSYSDPSYSHSSDRDSPYSGAPYSGSVFSGAAYSDSAYAGPSDSGSAYSGPYPAAADSASYGGGPGTDVAAPATEPEPDHPPDDREAVAMDGDAADRYPGGLPDGETEPSTARGRGRAGRNLPAAIGVGLGLGAVVLASLFLWRPAFLILIVVAVGVAIWELVRAISTSGANPPLVPLIAGGALMSGLAWWGRADALTFGLVVTVLAVMVWRLADGVWGYARDVAAATFVAVYVPFLAGFAAMLATPPDGDFRVLVMLALVVLSDTGGYVAGVRFGRHPMAPSVSPKKSWEGLAGSLVAAGVGGALMLFFLFDVAPWWGAGFGVAVATASVLGDLGESLVKRDLGVKDMSSLLPGHGGLMDRLDSILFAAPTAFALFTILVPAG